MISQLIRYDMNCQLGRCNKRWPQQHLPIDTTLLLILFAFKCTANNKPTEYNHETIILICIIAYLPLLSYASLCQPWNFPTPPNQPKPSSLSPNLSLSQVQYLQTPKLSEGQGVLERWEGPMGEWLAPQREWKPSEPGESGSSCVFKLGELYISPQQKNAKMPGNGKFNWWCI